MAEGHIKVGRGEGYFLSFDVKMFFLVTDVARIFSGRCTFFTEKVDYLF